MQGSTFSLRSDSVLSFVYGEHDVVLDEAIHKAMFDQAKMENGNNSLTLAQSESISVFQIKQGPQETSATSKTSRNNNTEQDGDKPVKKCCSCCAGISLSCSFWGPFRKRVKRVVESKTFETCIIFIILINTLFMSIQYHGMNEDLENAIDIVNSVSDLFLPVDALIPPHSKMGILKQTILVFLAFKLGHFSNCANLVVFISRLKESRLESSYIILGS